MADVALVSPVPVMVTALRRRLGALSDVDVIVGAAGATRVKTKGPDERPDGLVTTIAAAPAAPAGTRTRSAVSLTRGHGTATLTTTTTFADPVALTVVTVVW